MICNIPASYYRVEDRRTEHRRSGPGRPERENQCSMRVTSSSRDVYDFSTGIWDARCWWAWGTSAWWWRYWESRSICKARVKDKTKSSSFVSLATAERDSMTLTTIMIVTSSCQVFVDAKNRWMERLLWGWNIQAKKVISSLSATRLPVNRR